MPLCVYPRRSSSRRIFSPEMPRLDDACVHRPDRDFVHALSRHRDEGIVVIFRRKVGCRKIPAQRILVAGPGAVTQPLAVIRCAAGMQPQHIVHGALHAVGRRKEITDVGKRRTLLLHVKTQAYQPRVHAERRIHCATLAALALIPAPQRNQTSPRLMYPCTGRTPLLCIHRALPGRYSAGNLV